MDFDFLLDTDIRHLCTGQIRIFAESDFSTTAFEKLLYFGITKVETLNVLVI